MREIRLRLEVVLLRVVAPDCFKAQARLRRGRVGEFDFAALQDAALGFAPKFEMAAARVFNLGA